MFSRSACILSLYHIYYYLILKFMLQSPIINNIPENNKVKILFTAISFENLECKSIFEYYNEKYSLHNSTKPL